MPLLGGGVQRPLQADSISLVGGSAGVYDEAVNLSRLRLSYRSPLGGPAGPTDLRPGSSPQNWGVKPIY